MSQRVLGRGLKHKVRHTPPAVRNEIRKDVQVRGNRHKDVVDDDEAEGWQRVIHADLKGRVLQHKLLKYRDGSQFPIGQQATSLELGACATIGIHYQKPAQRIGFLVSVQLGEEFIEGAMGFFV